jgi:DNA-binding MarR family transcriptional regulator
MRIEALSSPVNRELLGIIATKQPRSVSELATLTGRLQPNVSRSLSALARAGLLTVTQDGRASIPTLTDEGQRKAEELRFVERAIPPSEQSSSQRIDPPWLSATIVERTEEALHTDDVSANVMVQFPMREGQQPLAAHALLNLNEVCTRLLADWWRLLYRRAEPHKMFPLVKEGNQRISHAMLLAESTGRIELIVRSSANDRDLWGLPQFFLSADDFSTHVLTELARPLVHRLRRGKRFDRPVESMLRRTREILAEPSDFVFWKSAGALGLSYHNMNDASTKKVTSLIDAISDENARLDFASAIDSNQLQQSLTWASDEITAKSHANSLPKLIELRRERPRAKTDVEPSRIGTAEARSVRHWIGLSSDRSVGGLDGLARMFGDDQKFSPSAPGEDLIRGFQGRGDDIPVIAVRNEGPKSTAFLVARGIGDYLVFGSREAPIADIYSDRQAVGRAFAAEFLAPAEGIIHMIDEEKASLDIVAGHYGVVKEVVRRQYENNIAQYATAA